MDLEVPDRDPLGVEGPHDVGQLVAALVEAHGDVAALGALRRAEASEHRTHALEIRGLQRSGLDRRSADLVLERVRGALGDDLARVDDPDPVGERVRLLEVLGGEEDGHALVARKPRDLVPERRSALDVQPGGRLVEEQQPGLVDQRQREVESAAHAARVAAHLAVGGVGEPDAGDQLVAAASCFVLADPVHAGL